MGFPSSLFGDEIIPPENHRSYQPFVQWQHNHTEQTLAFINSRCHMPSCLQVTAGASCKIPRKQKPRLVCLTHGSLIRIVAGFDALCPEVSTVENIRRS